MRLSDFEISSEWQNPPPRVALQTSEAHIWIASVGMSPAEASSLRALLSAEELERAARFRFEKDQVQYTAARGFLRLLLGRYLVVDPKAIRFGYNWHGKPFLADEFAKAGIEFNIAHSKGLGLFAFTMGHPIGVDIEGTRPDLATMEIAERFFAPAEVKVLAELPPESRIAAFFQCWTRKEAFVKARGMGLSLGLDKFAVAFGPSANPALLDDEEDPAAAPNWTLRDVSPSAGYTGAVAVEAPDVQVRLWRIVPPAISAQRRGDRKEE
jgi:4'-phosphopantetheinyl transferase